MNDYFQFKQEILKIVDAWKKTIKPHIEETGEYGETNTRKYIIDPILNALNWVDDGSKKIIDNEFAIKHQTGSGSADYALKVKEVPKILVEAKDVAKVKDLENGYDMVHGVKRTYPRQLSNYCHDLNYQGFEINFSILTNGAEWIVYNMQYADISSEREVIFRLELDDLDKDENLKKLWALEYGDFCKGYSLLKEIIQQTHDFRLNIDKKAVQQLLECKELLSSSILNDYEKDNRGIKNQIDDILNDKETINGMPVFQDIPGEDRLSFFIKEASSSVINKILFIRILEDRLFINPILNKRSIERIKDIWGYKDYSEIMNIFREACKITEKTYNGGLFQINPYDKIEYDPLIIKKIVDILGDINFREIDSDIIGRIYEIYLGQILKVESTSHGNIRTKYTPDYTERKKLGQYFTPKFVVDNIVNSTLGNVMNGKTLEEIRKIRILDPACGSGSFLINAFDVLAKSYEDWNYQIVKTINEKNRKNGGKLTHYQDTGAIPNYKNLILKENIHGVDLNDMSGQICEINLWLRALERDKKLLKLNKNILHGNSLITGVEDDGELTLFKNELDDIKNRINQIKEYYDKNILTQEEEKRLDALEKNLKFTKDNENKKLNKKLEQYFGPSLNSLYPFNWQVEFPQVMQDGGFDVVIGNPPWISFGLRGVGKLTEGEQNYYRKYLPNSAEYKLSTYALFIERALHLLKENGMFSFILPDSFLVGRYFSKLRRYILDTCCIKEILFFEWDVFNKEASTGRNVILVLQKEKDENKRLRNVMNILRCKKLDINENIEIVEKFQYEQSYFEKIIYNRFRLFFNKFDYELIKKIDENKCTIGDFLEPYSGCIGRYGQKSIISDDKKDSITIFDKKNNNIVYQDNNAKNKWQILIPSSSNVRKYFLNLHETDYIYIEPDSERRAVYAKSGFDLRRYKTEKLFMPQTGDSLVAAYSDKEVYCINNVHLLTLKSGRQTNIKYLQAILNSKLINYYYHIISLEFGRAMAQIDIETLEKIPIPNNIPINIEQELTDLVGKINFSNEKYHALLFNFAHALSNQPIVLKSSNFGSYFENYELYNIERETCNKINEIEAKILSLDIKAEKNKLLIYISYEDEEKLYANIKAVILTVEDNNLRNFLFFSIKKVINDSGGKGFGKGNLLKLIKEIYVPLYVPNAKVNIEKIKDVMREFENNTKELWWKDEFKKEKFSSLTEMEDEIGKTDDKINEMIYKLYDITEEDEKKIIEDSFKK